MKGVLLSINPSIQIVDITHDIESFNIEEAAYTLLACYRYFPPGTIFVVVVDPGVGSERRALLIVSRNYFFIGPDNGVLVPAAKADGIEIAIEIMNDEYFLKPTSKTFHGRDIFAPTAAWLSRGVSPSSFGPRIDISKLVNLDLGLYIERVSSDRVRMRVLHIDKFGNIALSHYFTVFREALNVDYGDAVNIIARNRVYQAKIVDTFSRVPKGILAIYENSFGFTEIAIFMGSAQKELELKRSDVVEIERVR